MRAIVAVGLMCVPVVARAGVVVSSDVDVDVDVDIEANAPTPPPPPAVVVQPVPTTRVVVEDHPDVVGAVGVLAAGGTVLHGDHTRTLGLMFYAHLIGIVPVDVEMDLVRTTYADSDRDDLGFVANLYWTPLEGRVRPYAGVVMGGIRSSLPSDTVEADLLGASAGVSLGVTDDWRVMVDGRFYGRFEDVDDGQPAIIGDDSVAEGRVAVAYFY